MIKREGLVLKKKEKVDEREFRRYAQSRGCIVRKFNSQKNDPDRAVLCPGGRAMFIEFKRKGESLREGQLHRLNQFADLGFFVCAAWTYAQAVDLLDKFLADET
jgi:hypothetical protein